MNESTKSMRNWARHPDTPNHLAMLLLGAADQIEDLEKRNETLSSTMTSVIENVKEALRTGTAKIVPLPKRDQK